MGLGEGGGGGRPGPKKRGKGSTSGPGESICVYGCPRAWSDLVEPDLVQEFEDKKSKSDLRRRRKGIASSCCQRQAQGTQGKAPTEDNEEGCRSNPAAPRI